MPIKACMNVEYTRNRAYSHLCPIAHCPMEGPYRRQGPWRALPTNAKRHTILKYQCGYTNPEITPRWIHVSGQQKKTNTRIPKRHQHEYTNQNKWHQYNLVMGSVVAHWAQNVIKLWFYNEFSMSLSYVYYEFSMSLSALLFKRMPILGSPNFFSLDPQKFDYTCSRQSHFGAETDSRLLDCLGQWLANGW